MSSLIAIWVMGFVGSTHCIAMCGSIAGSLGIASRNKETKAKHLKDSATIPVINQHPEHAKTNSQSPAKNHLQTKNIKLYKLLMFNLGRIISYILAGLLVGLLGFLSKDYLVNPAGIDIPRLISAVFIMLVGFYILDYKSSLAWIESLGNKLWQIIQPISRFVLPVRNLTQAFGLGLVWGWLPCGMVYSALILSAASPTPLLGGLHMLFFGLGTLPSMIAVGYLTQQLTRWKKQKKVRLFMFLTLIGCSLWTVYLAVPQLQLPPQKEHQHHH
jgi:uncharacterized protein